MKRWMSGALLMGACLWTGIGSSAEEPAHVWTIREVMEKNPLKEGEAAKWTSLAHPAGASLLLIQGVKQVPLHYHAAHDEMVVMVEGSGTFAIGSDQRTVGPQTILHIPKGTPHGGTFEGKFAAVIVYTPEFDLDKPDRVRVDQPK